MLLVLMLTSQEETSLRRKKKPARAKKEKLKLLTEILQIMVRAGTCSVRYEFTRRSHLRFIRQPKLKPHLHEQVFFDKEKLLV